MRSSLLAIAGAGAMLVNAQDAAPALETIKQFQAALGSCLEQCNAGDQDCQQQCIDSIHNPSGDNIVAIQYCQYGCVQGDGSYEQSILFHACLSACSNSNGTHRDPSMGDVVVSSSLGNASTNAPVSANGTATPTMLAAASTTAIGTSTGSSKTSSSVSATASSTATGVLNSDAGDILRTGMGGLGLSGLVVAFFM